MGFTIERSGFVSCEAVFTSLINDLADNGYTVIYSDDPDPTLAVEATLEAGLEADHLSATQPWRIKLNGNVPGGSVTLATELQLPDSGAEYTTTGSLVDPGRSVLNPAICGGIESTFIPEGTITPASPWSYRLTITDRGLAFELWQNTSATIREWSMLCVQRLVNPLTGEVYVHGHSPVMAISSLNSGASFQKMIVRENDVLAPTNQTTASETSEYNGAVMNAMKQISISETNQYYITFPAGFNTNRHLYCEEMDLIAYTSAGVLSQYNDARLNVYGSGRIDFNTGSAELVPGDTLVGALSGATAKVRSVELAEGTYGTGDASGVILVHSLDGEFSAGEGIEMNDVQVAVAALASVPEYRKYRGGNASINNVEGVRILFLVENGGV